MYRIRLYPLACVPMVATIACAQPVPKEHLSAALAALNAGKPEDALKSADRAIEIAPQFAQGHFLRGEAHSALRRHEEAVGDYRRVLELDPQVERVVRPPRVTDPQAVLALRERAMIVGELDPPAAAERLQVPDRTLRRLHDRREARLRPWRRVRGGAAGDDDREQEDAGDPHGLHRRHPAAGRLGHRGRALCVVAPGTGSSCRAGSTGMSK